MLRPVLLFLPAAPNRAPRTHPPERVRMELAKGRRVALQAMPPAPEPRHTDSPDLPHAWPGQDHAMRMPATYFGYVTTTRARCGICQRVELLEAQAPNPRMARRRFRLLGWEYVPEIGWTCDCRRRCEGLRPTPNPKRPRLRRRKSRERIRRQSIRRNRREIE